MILRPPLAVTTDGAAGFCHVTCLSKTRCCAPILPETNALYHITAYTMGAGPRYPYPKEVWSPAGGWWTRPRNWISNTVVCSVGIAIASYGVWNYSAEREWRHNAPTKKIPSMMWARQFREGELTVKEP